MRLTQASNIIPVGLRSRPDRLNASCAPILYDESPGAAFGASRARQILSIGIEEGRFSRSRDGFVQQLNGDRPIAARHWFYRVTAPGAELLLAAYPILRSNSRIFDSSSWAGLFPSAV